MSRWTIDTLWRLMRYLGGQWLVQLLVVALASGIEAHAHRQNEFGGLAWVIGAWAVMVTGLVSAPLWMWLFFRSARPWRWGLVVSGLVLLGTWAFFIQG
jgi:hypothetical protein